MNNKCPKCSKEFEKGTKFCLGCGCNLELEYIENPICPICKTLYPTNTKFCINDGSKLVRQEDLIHRCVICNTPYSDDTKFCPIDGGEVKIILPGQSNQPIYGQTQSYQKCGMKKYPKASILSRFFAAFFDGMFSLALSIPAIIFYSSGIEKLNSYLYNEDAIGLFFIASLFLIIPLIYNLIKDGLGQGQSWGKRIFDLMVVNLDNNSPCNVGKSLIRNLISGLLCMIPFVGWLIEPIMVLVNEDGIKLGDRAANTQVIDKRTFKK